MRRENSGIIARAEVQHVLERQFNASASQSHAPLSELWQQEAERNR